MSAMDAKWTTDSRFEWKAFTALGIASLMILAIVANAQPIPRAAAMSPPKPPSLGTAAGFGVLSAGAVSNTGPSNVTGNLGVYPSAAVIGFPPGVVTGTVYKDDSVALQAKSDLAGAYNTLAADSCTRDLTHQNLGGLTLTPGVYCYSSAASLTGTLTLNTGKNLNALYVFQIAGSLSTSSSSSVIITSGSGCNVFWQVGGAAFLGRHSTFEGSILSVGSITMGTGANSTGAAMTQGGSVTLATNHVGAYTSAMPCWQQQVTNLALPSAGCFEASFPVVQWIAGGSNCVEPKGGPLAGGTQGNDYEASSATNIYEAQGYVSAASGLTSEYDSKRPYGSTGQNFYGIQDNTNTFSTTYNGSSTTGWEQFAFLNNASAAAGYVFIEYWLIGWFSTHTSCPSTHPSYLSVWRPDSIILPYSCWANSALAYHTPEEDPSGILNYQLKGYANINGNDESVFCNGPSCYATAVPYTVLNLAGGWTSSEWNILGFQSSSGACFNITPPVSDPCPNPSGSPSMTIYNYLYNSSGQVLLESCISNQGWTAEYNNLNLKTCTVANSQGGGYMYFTEGYP